MINALQIRNFKSLADTGKPPNKAIDVFSRAQQFGKTSIIQSLLLLRQTVKSPSKVGTSRIPYGRLRLLVSSYCKKAI